jgi:hypothetical protein
VAGRGDRQLAIGVADADREVAVGIGDGDIAVLGEDRRALDRFRDPALGPGLRDDAADDTRFRVRDTRAGDNRDRREPPQVTRLRS